jgi:hypothetical protein
MLSIISYQSQEIYSTISEQPVDEAVNFSDFNEFDFMIGFTRVFLPDAGSIEVTLDKFNDGRKMASIPIEVDICPDTHPGVATTN